LDFPVKPSGWPDAVVFDLDGTLIDSAADIARALNEAMSANGLSCFSLEQVKEMIGGGVVKLLERALAAQGAPVRRAVPIAAEFLDFYAAVAMAETALYPGAEEQLSRLAAAGVKIGLCTNKPQTISERILRELGIDGYFSSVVGGRDDMPRKPHPAPLQAVMDELGSVPTRSLMVGDSSADVGAARALGLRVAVASYGYSKVPVRELGADMVIDALGELSQVFATIGFGSNAA
jgi:phosphoglycolate phosphatase